MSMLRQELLDGCRGRIVAVLQRGRATVDEIASRLNLTANAVRAQLIGMEREGGVSDRQASWDYAAVPCL